MKAIMIRVTLEETQLNADAKVAAVMLASMVEAALYENGLDAESVKWAAVDPVREAVT